MVAPPELDPAFVRFAARVIVCHVVTYMLAGLVASTLLDYESRWQDPLFAFMRPFDSPWVALGPALQVGVLSTYGPAPGSLEGIVYTRFPLEIHLFGLPEVVGQAALFSMFVVAWHRRPHRAWAIVFGIVNGLTLLMSLAGVFLA